MIWSETLTPWVTVTPGWLIRTTSDGPGTWPVLQLLAVSKSPLEVLVQVTVGSRTSAVPETKLGIRRPIRFALCCVNQRLPSEPVVTVVGKLPAVGIGKRVIVPLGVIRPMLLPNWSQNQRLPSGPVVIPRSEL